MNIILSGEKLKAFPLRSRKSKAKMFTLPLLFNIVLEIVTKAIRQERERKFIQVEEEEVKLSLFADNIILCVETLKILCKKLLEQINEFSKVAGYKINTEKSVEFLHMNNEQSENKIMKTILFKIASKECNMN